ncbi:hypothetical protein CFN78_10715 [Amycolatopsis antarctica]|uniref:Integral membrane bound transporter domain-containing protein n=1 Tax=Amycolatopsis antarctica TaxID=1854586 RepID=A0A263D5Y5_9PSEU|nr:FUSC family protein [Amycolatopsis antarctica]OZM73448.1 hypothetical protein CFN78_10715 [Amycolatopsis antarctica]
MPWSRAVRAALALAVPLAVGLALGDIGLGALVSTGALPTVLSEAAGPYRYRARRIGGATAAAAVGYAIGLFAGASPWTSVPAVIGIAAVSALVSAAGNNASNAGLQFFVFGVLGTGQHAMGIGLGVSLLCFLAGAAWGLTVALAAWTVRATTPERSAVAQVYIELAAMLSAEDEHTSRAARHQLTTAMNTAYDRLLTARSWLSGRDATYRALLNRLAAGTPAVEASVAIVNAGQRAPREVVTYLASVATSILAAVPVDEPPEPAADASPAQLALYAGLERIAKGEQRGRRDPAPLREKVRDWATSLIAGPLTWIAAARLTLCVAIAEAAGLLVPFERSYWITLTVGIVLKPDFGSVFGRAVLRGIGTVAGVGLGAAALGIGAPGWALVLLAGVFAAGAAIGKVRNYGILSAFVTPLIILQMDLTNQGDWPVVLARLVDTVLGCAIVLVFGYLLWPGSRRPRVGGLLADVVDAVGAYVERGLLPAGTADERAERSRCRRLAYRGLADLRTAFQQVVVEPSAAGRQAAAWWPVIVALEQVTDAVTEVVVTVEHGAPAPAAGDVELLSAALGELAASVRQQRHPRDGALPEHDQLSGVVDQLRSAFDAVRGPDLSARTPSRVLRRFRSDR